LSPYGVLAISFDLPHSLGVLVSSPERIIVENLTAGTVDMLDITGDDPDLRIRWRGCAKTSRNQDRPKIKPHGQKPPLKAKAYRYDCLVPGGRQFAGELVSDVVVAGHGWGSLARPGECPQAGP
jgi:hypothetical protein